MTVAAEPTTPLRDYTGTWEIDPTHSTLGFAVKHAMVTTARGLFHDFTGTLRLDGEHPERSTAKVTVQMDSIDTGNGQRDGHLRTNDFFAISEFPTMSFRSTRAEARGDDEYRMYGELTIRGVTKEVAIDLTLGGVAVDPYGNQRIGFEGTTTISRKDFGITWNAPLETGGLLVADKVRLHLDIAAVRQQ